MRETLIIISGFGSVGRRHFRNLKSLGFTDFVFHRSFESTLTTDEIAAYPSVSTVEDALRYRPTLTFVTNPTALHLSVALSCARMGCHLFVEKPLSHTLEGCEELGAACHERDLTTMIGCQYRFHPLVKSLRGQLRAGRLGEVLSARGEYGEYLPDWHPSEDHRRGYVARKDLGGGAILSLVHPIDYFYWLFGPVRDVHASVGRVKSLQTDVDDDIAEVTIDFASGAIGQVHLDYIQRPPVHPLTVLGEKGRARLDFLGERLCWELLDGNRQMETTPAGFEPNTMFVEELKHFLECVKQRKPTLTSLSDGVEVLKIALKAKEDASRRKQ